MTEDGSVMGCLGGGVGCKQYSSIRVNVIKVIFFKKSFTAHDDNFFTYFEPNHTLGGAKMGDS